MPKYVALVLLYSKSTGEYIQPGETIELDEPVIEKLHLNAGHIKPKQEKKPAPPKDEAASDEPIKVRGHRPIEGEPDKPIQPLGYIHYPSEE
jgi:hypothetical protein